MLAEKPLQTTGGDDKKRNFLRLCTQALWYLMLVTLPITSFPVLSAFFGASPVKPFALILLVPLALLWLLDRRVQARHLPWQLWPIGLFGGIAALSIFSAAFLPIAPIKGHVLSSEGIKGFASLLIGGGYLILTCTHARGRSSLKYSLRAITFGGLLVLIWSSIQASYVLAEGRRVPLILNNIHRLFVDRDLIYNRVSGFAYEPSWLGNQLMVLYLPIWAASLWSGFSVFPKKWKKISLEAILLGWGLIILLLTQSRNSYITLLFIAFLGLIYAGGKLSNRIAGRKSAGPVQSIWRSTFVRILVFASILAAFMQLIVGLAWGISHVDRRMTRLLEVPGRLNEIKALYPNEELYQTANRLAFAERLVYWEAAFRVFERFPILGVGLGNSGFLFPEVVPRYGYSLVEIQYILDPENLDLANPKNLWIRILSETGIAGASAYLAWYIALAVTALWLAKSRQNDGKMIGVMGILFLLAQIVEGFSIDTFALPYIWIPAGLILSQMGQALEG